MHTRPRIIRLLIAFGLLGATITPAVAAPAGGSSTRSGAPTTASEWKPQAEECAFVALINNYRQQNGLGTLTISLTLGAAAEHHSIDMAINGYFGHTLADGTTWDQNIANHGYPSDSSRALELKTSRRAVRPPRDPSSNGRIRPGTTRKC